MVSLSKCVTFLVERGSGSGGVKILHVVRNMIYGRSLSPRSVASALGIFLGTFADMPALRQTIRRHTFMTRLQNILRTGGGGCDGGVEGV